MFEFNLAKKNLIKLLCESFKLFCTSNDTVNQVTMACETNENNQNKFEKKLENENNENNGSFNSCSEKVNIYLIKPNKFINLKNLIFIYLIALRKRLKIFL